MEIMSTTYYDLFHLYFDSELRTALFATLFAEYVVTLYLHNDRRISYFPSMMIDCELFQRNHRRVL